MIRCQSLYHVYMMIASEFLFMFIWSSCKLNAAFAQTPEHHFKSTILANEYIVQFNNFYRSETRAKHLTIALARAKISSWEIQKRINPASIFPSDFDVIFVNDGPINQKQIRTLKLHALIKAVVPHRSVKRTLYYRNDSFDTSYQKVGRHLLRAIPSQIATAVQADQLWAMGITGAGMKVAVFDTGLPSGHPHFKNVKERSNWTNEKTLDDGVSHGTFVAGVIASAKECRGIAPDAELHIYRVFTNSQVSYTSWFLDAFNYAIFRRINIINLSIGGPDFLDSPFVDKVLELSANKVIMVSAIGNDGPLYGTLNNPGDQSDVIGVGGLNFEEQVARFSSRGMTTWELPKGYGRLKPDIMTYGSQVKGSDINGGCRSLSGTSVASPVIAGAIALIASGAPHKMKYFNPSSMKQVLFEGASRLPDSNMFEQGHGKLNIVRSAEIFSVYKPKITLSPSYLDTTESYMWPYSSQPLFCGSMPIVVNVTILNGISVSGKITDSPQWHPHEDKQGNVLKVAITYSTILWPWSGWMALHIAINKEGCQFKGVAEGHISLTVESSINDKTHISIRRTIYFPIKILVTPKPPKHKRILWDQYHNLRYPPGYIPRDNLKVKSDPLDWRADHIHTNFREMYIHLRNSGYYVDVLQAPYTCFNASDYGTLLIVDPEEEFFDEEILKIQTDVYDLGMSIIVFADWYNTSLMKKIKFFDENTRQWWIPDTGGSNIPALNELLEPFEIALSDFVSEGYFKWGDHTMYVASGTTISKTPQNPDDILIGANVNDQGAEMLGLNNSVEKRKVFKHLLGLFQTTDISRNKYRNKKTDVLQSYDDKFEEHPVLNEAASNEKNPILNKRVLLNVNQADVRDKTRKANIQHLNEEKEIKQNAEFNAQTNSKGRIAIFSDSNCLDSTHLDKPCFWLLGAILEFTMNSYKPALLQRLNKNLGHNFTDSKRLPLRLSSSSLHYHSKILNSSDKFLKLPVEKCTSLQWAEPIMVNSSDLQQLLSYIRTPPKDSTLGQDTTEVLQKNYINLPNKDRNEDYIEWSFVFIAMLSLGILILLMKYFWKRKTRTFSWIRSLNKN